MLGGDGADLMRADNSGADTVGAGSGDDVIEGRGPPSGFGSSCTVAWGDAPGFA
jgi:hypothetical protein